MRQPSAVVALTVSCWCTVASGQTDVAEEPPALLPEAAAPAVDAPCAEGVPCEPGPLLAAWLGFHAALLIPNAEQRDVAVASAVQQIGALKDPRAITLLLRLSQSPAPSVRLSALASLGLLMEDPRALDRLRQVLASARPGDLEVVLPPLLAWAASHPGASTAPCPDGGACVDDAKLLAAMLAYTDAPTVDARAKRVKELGALADVRTMDLMVRLSFDGDEAMRSAAVQALAVQGEHPRAKARLLELLGNGTVSDRLLAVAGLASQKDPRLAGVFLERRRVEQDPSVKEALEKELVKRSPDAIAALLEEERLAALEAENAPDAFDMTMRGLLSASAGVSAAVGGAAASSVAAEAVLGEGYGQCFGAWGGCMGGASAAAITWFALGDRRLGGADVGLALSTTLAGGYAGLLIPPTIGGDATADSRHMIYAASAGALVGLTGGTVAALLTHPQAEDIAELNFTWVGANLLTAGVLLSVGEGDDPRPLFGALIGATVLGSAGGGVAAYFLDEDGLALVHTGLLMGTGLGAGLFAGGARQAFTASDNGGAVVTGAGLLGAALGTGVGLGLGQAKITPSVTGMVYETWAAIDYAAIGAGAGLLVGNATGDPLALSLAGTAAGAVIGAGSTFFFPDGITQDYGDLLLQPLLVGFGIYHGAVLVGFATEDPELTVSAGLMVPALASAGLVYAAPFVRAGAGDVLMMGSMMGLGAYLSAMGMLSASAHGATIPGWGYVLATSLAMDAGLAAGVALDLLDVDFVGWRTTYVLAVATATTLVVALPGVLVASAVNSPVAVPDVLLGSTVVGLAAGLLTMQLIDFRIAPDFGLGKRPAADEPAATVSQLQVVPTLVVMAPLKDESAQVGLGVVGRF